MNDDDMKVIFAYTRAQAIEDGVLVDVTETAKEVGFKYPVALTQAVYAECVQVPDGVKGQDEAGRLWDVLFMCACEARKSREESTIFFKLYVRNDNHKTQLVKLKSVCHPGDDGSPCITIMRPDED